MTYTCTSTCTFTCMKIKNENENENIKFLGILTTEGTEYILIAYRCEPSAL